MNVFDLFAKLSLDSTEYEQGLGKAEKKGSKFGSGLKAGAKVAVGALAATTAATAATTKAFVSGISAVAQYGDTVDKESQKLGISATAYQEWDAILQHTGGSINNIKPAMKTLAKEAMNNSKAFQELGISQKEVATLSKEEIFEKTITALQSMPDSMERTRLATQLLGKSSVELGALLNTSAEDTEKMRQTVHELGGVMEDDAVKASAQFQDNLQDLQTSIDGVKRNLLTGFLPSVSTVMEGLTQIFSGNDVEGGVEKIGEGIKTLAENLVSKASEVMKIGVPIIKSLVDAITTNLPILLQAAVPIVMELVTGIINNLPTLVSAAGSLLGALAQGLIDNMPQILSAIQSLILMIGQGLADNAPNVVPAIVGLITTIATTLTDPSFLTSILDAGLAIIEGLINGIIEAIPVLVNKLPVIIDNIISVIMKGVPMILNAAIKLFGAIVKALPTIIQSLNTALPQIIMMILEQLPIIINSISSFLISAMPMIMDAAITLFNGIVDAIPVILDLLMVLLPDIIQSICDFLINSMPVIMDAAITLLMAIVQAIPKIVTALAQQLPMIISAILNTFSSNLPAIIQGAIQLLMGIIEAIPTIVVELGKNMPEIIGAILAGIASGMGSIFSAGVNLIQGLWNGISSMKDWIWSKIKDFGGGIVQALKNFFGIHSPSTLFENEIGKNLAYGLGLGFDEALPATVKGMEKSASDAASDIVDAFNDPLNNMSVDSSFGMGDYTMKATGGFNSTASTEKMLNSFVPAITNAIKDLQLNVPVYIGQNKIDQQVATANARNNVISGGR